MVYSRFGLNHGEHQPVVFMDKHQLCLKLARRKNMPQGCLLKRSCWCASCSARCPVHVLGKLLAGSDPDNGLQNGNSLTEILQAGQWRSPVFRQYLDVNVLEHLPDMQTGVWQRPSRLLSVIFTRCAFWPALPSCSMPFFVSRIPTSRLLP